MVLPLIAAGVGGLGSTYFNWQGAKEREAALQDVAGQEGNLAQWYANQNSRLMSQNQQKYGDLSRARRAGIDEMLAGYTLTPQVTPQVATEVKGDPRFDMNLGSGWANTSRARIGRSISLQNAVRSADDLAAAEQLQRAQAMGAYQQGEARRGAEASDYGDLAAIRQQILANQMALRQGEIERARANASQAGSEKMLYGGLFGLAGNAGASFLPIGGGSTAPAGVAMPSSARAGAIPNRPWDLTYNDTIAKRYGGGY